MNLGIRSAARKAEFKIRRFNEANRQARIIQRLEQDVAEHEPRLASQESPVLFFNASTRTQGMSLNGAFSLLTSWGLRLAGVPVLYFACDAGLPQCTLGTRVDAPWKDPPCNACTRFTRQIFPDEGLRLFSLGARSKEDLIMLSDLSLDQLIDLEWNALPIGRLCEPSLLWALRKHKLVDEPATRTLLGKYIAGAINLAQAFDQLIESEAPGALVIFNGITYPEAITRAIAMKHGIRTITHEVGALPYSAFFSAGLATAYEMEIPGGYELGPDEDRLLDQYLSMRFEGEFSMAGIRFWPEIQGLDEHLITRMSQFQQVVTVFTNVIFDTSQAHANILFTDMFEWLEYVVDVIRKTPGTLFIIRAHPDEARPGKSSVDSVASWAVSHSLDSLPNVVFIGPNTYISSYELIKVSKFIMVYNSSIGLEGTLLGVPVLCAGQARYTHYPTVFFPPDPPSYRTMLEAFLTRGEIAVPDEFMTQARRLLFFQLFHTSLDYTRFLTSVPHFPGQVRFKDFSWRLLHPDECEETRIVMAGIRQDGQFTYPTPHINSHMSIPREGL